MKLFVVNTEILLMALSMLFPAQEKATQSPLSFENCFNKKSLSLNVDGKNYNIIPTKTKNIQSLFPADFQYTYWTPMYRKPYDSTGYYSEFIFENATINTGVYANFIPHFYSDAVLQSGAVQTNITEDSEYHIGINESVSFSFDMAFGLWGEMAAKLSYDWIDVSGGMKAGMGFGFHQSYSYTMSASFSGSTKTTRALNSAVAKYCPAGYGISIGLVGEWVEITGHYKEWRDNFWTPDNIDKEGDFTLRIAYLGHFTETFIYANGSDTLYLAPSTGSVMKKAPMPKC